MADDSHSTLEEWRPVPGYPGYEVSNLGRIQSLDKIFWHTWSSRGVARQVIRKSRIIRGSLLLRRGRVVAKYFQPRDDAKRLGTVLFHRAVLGAFVGPCPDGMECCHGDGNPLNNVLSNLRWDTHVENIRDSMRHGTWFGGRNSNFVRATES